MTVNSYSSQIALFRRPGDYSQAEDQITWPTSTEIDLTQEMCRYVGSEPIRSGTAYLLSFSTHRGDDEGTLSDMNLGNGTTKAAVTLVIWDDATKAHTATVTASVTSARANTGTITIPSTIAPGRYRCALVVAWPAGATWTHCEGTLDVVQKVPA